MEHEKNTIAITLTIAGYMILLIGLAAGLWLGTELSLTTETGGVEVYTPHPLRWVYGGAVIGFSVVTGLLFLGFGENLRILHRLANQ